MSKEEKDKLGDVPDGPGAMHDDSGAGAANAAITPSVTSDVDDGSNTNPSGGEENHVRIRVEFMDNVDFYRLKRNQSFKKLMNKFCSRHGIDYGVVRFLYDGRRLRATDTPTTVDMEDQEETVEVFTEACGGRGGV